jgi:hypothetical protein
MAAGIVPLGVGRVPLGTAPVDVRRTASAAHLHSLMRGSSFYGAGAGGFGQVPALPRLQHFAQPANANRDVELVQLYAAAPVTFRRRLQQQFNPRPRS